MSRYDRAVTVFSPDGHLLQVEYAQEAVRRSSSVVGICGGDSVVIAAERKRMPKFFDGRTEKKVVEIDKHAVMAYAGLRADARCLITRAQIECQAHLLTVEDSATIEYIARYIAQMKQLYTQCNGRRPFGVSCLVGGVDCTDGVPHLFQTEPSGVFYEWKAAATGRNEQALREFLEKNYNAESVCNEEGAIRLALRTLIEGQNLKEVPAFEVAVVKKQQSPKFLDSHEIESFVNIIKKHKTTTS